MRVGGVKYGVLKPYLITKTVECITHSFANSRDPFTRALGLSPKQWGTMAEMFVHRAATRDISVVAFNENDDRVEGVIVNEDWKEAPPIYFKDMPDWGAVKAIFNELHTRFKARQPRIEHGKVIHPLYFTCVRPELRNHGIAQNLWNETVEIARSHNYDSMVAEASARASYHLLKKLGFVEIAHIPYQEFLFEGKAIFAHLDQTEFETLSIWKRSVTSNLFI